MKQNKGLKFTKHFPFDETPIKRFDVKITGNSGEVLYEQNDVKAPETWSQTAVNIAASKYFKEGETSVYEMVGRVVKTIKKWGEDGNYFASKQDQEEFGFSLQYILLSQRAAFNTPVWINLGVNDPPQTSACFINSVEDSMEGIYNLAKIEGMLFKEGSGSGTNFSTLRSSKEKLSKGGYASGPVSFMKGLDAFAGVVKSGGRNRRSARICILNVDHPDIEEFIDCKMEEEKKIKYLIANGFDPNMEGKVYSNSFFQNANNSARVTDNFMKAIERNEAWCLREVNRCFDLNRAEESPGLKRVLKTVKAGDLFKKIAKAAWECGDPGIIFHDRVNQDNTVPDYGEIQSCNPCVSGDTLITLADLSKKRIDQMQGSKHVILTKSANGFIEVEVNPSFCKGRKKIYLLTTRKYWKELRCTEDHLIMLTDGSYKAAKDLTEYDSLYLEGHKSESIKIIDTMATFTYYGEEDVYDLIVPGFNNYIANGIVVHNCGEFMFLDNTACNLTSLNLDKFFEWKTKEPLLLLDDFKHVVRVMITAMDILIDNSSYPTDEIKANSIKFRPLGLGFSNLGSVIMKHCMPYNSKEACDAAEYLTKHLTGQAKATSKELYDCLGCNFRSDAIYVIGQRNAQVTLMAPTGTIGFLMDCDTTGIEPELALVKHKKLSGGGEMLITNPNVKYVLRKLGYQDKECMEYEKTGKLDVKPEHRAIFDCAFEDQDGRCISPMGHLNMMAAIQPWISGAISKSVNLPNSATVEDIEQIYIKAWELGLKSITVYRDGSKGAQPLTSVKKGEDTVNTISAKQIANALWNTPLSPGSSVYDNPKLLEQVFITNAGTLETLKDMIPMPSISPTRKRLPAERKSLTHRFKIGEYTGYITAGMYEDGQLGEIFVNISQSGSTLSGMVDAFSTCTSMALQYGVPLEALHRKFTHSRFEPSGFTSNQEIPHAKSIIDYIFKWIALHFGKDKHVEKSQVKETIVPGKRTGEFCKRCGSEMRQSGSCFTCSDCGDTSGCG